ncbi:hypothetical protein J7E93_13055 [Streptomyces sp. ISL-36]|uniref:hypothetical protein n=1 Tax=Streptomyces sp. ISL-36 TaxID=2819182 RepID=UPI001BECD0BD|nr:hypothetical protein [Streptomyces sp. ISL-36]MBT2441023.1 hypothetical protein [Streptomyces sp. ISL-36]
MLTFKKTAAVLLATGALVALGAAPSNAAPAPHPITCGWDQGQGTPWSASGTTVTGFVRVKCSDSLDDANTRAQLQIFRDGDWYAHGAGVTSYSTATVIQVNDSATKRTSTWYYRTVGTHFGQHGNVWTLPTYYSPSRALTGVS